MERESSALHRHPSPVHRHRERRVDEEGDAGLRARLGLLDLDVADLDAHASAGVAASSGRPGDRVGHRARDVPRFGVAEVPFTRGPRALTRGSRPTEVAIPLSAGHPLGDVSQQHLAELAHGLRGEPQDAVGSAPESAGVAESLLQLPQGEGVGPRLVAELAGEGVEVEVVHPRAGVRLGELLGELVELRDVLEHPGAVAESEAVLAIHPLGTAPVLTGPQRPKRAVETGERLEQIGRPEGLLGEGVELAALLIGHRVAQALGGRGPLGERVEELVDIRRGLREVLSVLCHELVELFLAVLPFRMRLEQLVQVVEHRRDRGAVVVGGVLEGVLHPRKPLVEHLASEQVLDLLEVGPGLGALPVVAAEFGHRRRRGGREAVELHLGEGAVRVVQVDVARELGALGVHGPVEQFADLGERAVEIVFLGELPPAGGDAAGEVVEAGTVPAPTAQELAHRPLGRVPGHHVFADRVERLGHVDGRGKRIGPTGVGPVAGGPGETAVRPSHRSSRLPRSPC